jgi:hypothetical protein
LISGCQLRSNLECPLGQFHLGTEIGYPSRAVLGRAHGDLELSWYVF